jgi:hypothetical protein
MKGFRIQHHLLLLLLLATTSSHFLPRIAAFAPLGSSPSLPRLAFRGRRTSAHFSAKEEAAALLERARQMRAQAAALQGLSVEQVEQEALQTRQNAAASQERAAAAAAERKNNRKEIKGTDGSFLSVPDTADDQVYQAARAVERAFAAGVTRQIVRFALVPQDQVLRDDRPWPGGAQEMYREAAGPMTLDLLRSVRARTANATADKETADALALTKPPAVTAQDIWDFDGSALVTAQAVAGASDDVQAMVLPNTDNRYSTDIATINKAMGDRLFLLVNPFWRNLESWGFNILAPKAKQMAQEAIFDAGYQETYVLLQKSVRGEECIALKAFPYDWQLYAYAESDYWPHEEYIVYLGSTPEEPMAVAFTELLNQRDEFKMSKNMRQMQRMMNKDE